MQWKVATSLDVTSKWNGPITSSSGIFPALFLSRCKWAVSSTRALREALVGHALHLRHDGLCRMRPSAYSSFS